MYKLFLALRYLRRQRITFFPLAGVTLAVTALVTVTSVMKGLDVELIRSIRAVKADMTVDFLDARGLQASSRQELDVVIRRIEAAPEIAAVSPFVTADAVATITGARNGKPFTHEGIFAQIRGVGFDKESAVSQTRLSLKYGGNPFAGSVYGTEGSSNAFIIGARMVEQVDDKQIDRSGWGPFDRGDNMRLLTLGHDGSVKITTGNVVDIFRAGERFVDVSRVYMPIDWARAFTRMGPNALSGIDVKLKLHDAAAVASAKNHIADALAPVALAGTYTVTTWQEDYSSELACAAIARSAMTTIVFFFLVIAAFSIAAILILIVLEKVRDIGVLRSMGSSAAGIAGVFLAYGTAIGVAGSTAGLAFGVGLAKGINFAERVYQMRAGKGFLTDFSPGGAPQPAILDWRIDTWIVIAAIALSFVAGIAPAVRAARIAPAEAVRHE